MLIISSSDMDVLVVGGGFSGTNLAIIIADKAKSVTISRSATTFVEKMVLKMNLPKKCSLVGKVVKFENGKFHFSDKKTARVDRVIFATGSFIKVSKFFVQNMNSFLMVLF